MKVEIFYTPTCGKCGDKLAPLRDAASKAVPGIDWQEINVLENIDYAVELGVLTLPSIVINQEVAFSALPSPNALVRALRQRSDRRT